MNEAVVSPAAFANAATVVAPASWVNFDRPLVCLLGLPFDAINIAQAVHRIRADAFARRRCFVSTPNLNFVITARSDAAFRGSVLHSDLSLIDGMPLVWVARLLRLPVPGRVSGADVFEALQAHPGPAINVYLFGGPPGIGERACDQINRRGGGLRCVGFDTPGFGSVESMSSEAHIARINGSGAQFVVVALGAKKGQAWIEHNAPLLTAPVLSHLGAVVNFAAGGVLRAPAWMQWSGLEWLWRIKEEPALWRRYWGDGLSGAWLLLTRVLPDAVRSLVAGHQGPGVARVEVHQSANGTTLALHGPWSIAGVAELRAALTACAAGNGRVTIDMSCVTDGAAAIVATLLVAKGWFGALAGFDVVGASPVVAATFRRKLADRALLGVD
jgi:N-acetylglucosaminyldiphosphoundecaprenol N-acetyl-beta-D-mannosaminyltransferase